MCAILLISKGKFMYPVVNHKINLVLVVGCEYRSIVHLLFCNYGEGQHVQ